MPRRISGHPASWLIPLALALICVPSFAQDPNPSDTPVTQWEKLVPQITASLPRPCPDLNWEIKILDAAEIPAGGPSYAIVDYCDNAPSSDSVVVMQLQAGKPVLARFRDAHKKIIDPNLLQAASVTEFADVRLTLDRTAILDFRQENDAHGLPLHCHVTAYVWNPATSTFDYNARRSREATHGECGE